MVGDGNKYLCPRDRNAVSRPVPFCAFSHSLPKGTVSATINIIALSFMATSVELARWFYFQAGGRIAFHFLAMVAGIIVMILVFRLLKLRQQHLNQTV